MRMLAPENLKDRFDVYRFYNGISIEGKEGLDRRQNRVPLVKTFLLEHVGSKGNGHPKSPEQIYNALGAEIRQLDDTFWGLRFPVTDPDTNRLAKQTTGFLEQFDERFFAYYTSEESVEAIKRVRKWVLEPDLDHTWFSSPLMQVLWNQDVSQRGDHRFGKLVFRHESIFDMPEDSSLPEESLDDSEDDTTDEEEKMKDDQIEVERRKARFEMGDNIGRIKRALNKLQENYDPLNALYSIRFPSRTRHGGHDLYQDGRITNRTDSFENHRNTVLYLYHIYNSVLAFTEKVAWHEINQTQTMNVGMQGVPLIVKFAEPLNESTFNRWIQLAFQKRNRFKLWGNPIRLGPTKVHVYGADRHLWQPINMEITSKQIVAILPQGTCGNTFHRLVSNIQHYVSPKIDAWVGSKSFKDVVSKWPVDAEISDEN